MLNAPPVQDSKGELLLYRILEEEYVNLHGPLPPSYPWLFLPSHLLNPFALINKLRQRKEPAAARIAARLQSLNEAGRLDGRARRLVNYLGEEGTRQPTKEEAGALKGLLNRLLLDSDLFDPKAFERLGPEAEKLSRQLYGDKGANSPPAWQINEVARLNRLLFEHAFPKELARLNESSLKNLPAALRETLAEGGGLQRAEDEQERKMSALRLAAIYHLIHTLPPQQRRTALCLSGGGIRSATFNLGLLQGFARYDLLGNFDYLSTVSGGGYIGSWLSAWIYRHERGERGVSEELSRKPGSPVEPEPPPVQYLREYSNHQTPQVGLLSADFWTLIGVYLRNLFLNWLTFIPLLLAVLMIPRVCVSMVRAQPEHWQTVMLWLGFLAAAVAVVSTALNLPSSGKSKYTQSHYLARCLLPVGVSALSFSAYWVCPNDSKRVTFSVGDAVFWACAVGMTGLVTYVLARFARRYNPKCYGFWRITAYIVGAFVLVNAAAAVTGLIGWNLLQSDVWRLHQGLDAGGNDPRLFVTLGPPVLLLLYILGGTLCAGLTSRWTAEDDQEWWARSGAWIFIAIVAWLSVHALVLYGPQLLFSVPWTNLSSLRWRDLFGILPAVVGVVSGALTLLGGFSFKTDGAHGKDDRGRSAPLAQRLSKLAAPLFLCFLVVLLAALTNWLMVAYSTLVELFTAWYYSGRPGLLPAALWEWARLPPRLFAQLVYEESPAATEHLALLKESPLRQTVSLFGLLGLFGWLMGLIIDSNKFSLHSYYGNRLKRTYLGASRKKREGNLFTGFDTCDNIQMHEMRPAWLHRKSFRDLAGFIERLKVCSPNDPLASHLAARLGPITTSLLAAHNTPGSPSDQLKSAVIHEVNRLIEEDRFPLKDLDQARLHPDIARLIAHGVHGETRVLLNRLILESAFPNELRPYRPPKLFHVVSMALNLARSDKLAWQERRAETFTVSPLHAGNLWLGYRRARHYGGRDGISLGTAFTISGAAANPNMGYMLSSPLASFLMSMFNVRLGWWLGNPGPNGEATYRRDVPKFVLGPLVQEALSLADDKKRYVHLSDGGHFENLGLYEMVLRRCHTIVVSDASTDASYSFDSLGMAIRKIRVDFGIPIEFEEFRFAADGQGGAGQSGRHCAIARIRYSCVDEDGTDGVLVYIKPSFSGDEPRDIQNYRKENERFPQDSIVDQFFDEPQFESYRMLGSHIVEEVCGAKCENIAVKTFVARAYDHWRRSQQRVKWMDDYLGRGEPAPPGRGAARHPKKPHAAGAGGRARQAEVAPEAVALADAHLPQGGNGHGPPGEAGKPQG